MLLARDLLVRQFIAEATRAEAHAGDAVDGVYGQGEAENAGQIALEGCSIGPKWTCCWAG